MRSALAAVERQEEGGGSALPNSLQQIASIPSLALFTALLLMANYGNLDVYTTRFSQKIQLVIPSLI
ncbi:MAG: hypothetical protein HC866_21320 [Leptolyngbyaceae cyanobacterium RU_5_1]|nr:hypothetical protein [Leptolyngbyaceae cyanobacterium RU_5_1]